MPVVGFNQSYVSVFEGNLGVTKVQIAIMLSSPSASSVVVNYTTDARNYGTAARYEDYTPITESITFFPGEVIKFITIDVIGDLKYEGNESFYVDLTSAIGADIVNDSVDSSLEYSVGITIKNDDVSTIPTVGFRQNNSSILEGNSGIKNIEIAVDLSSPSNLPVVVYYTTDESSGSAARYEDFTPVTGSITFAPGEITKFINIDVIGDTKYEGNENFYVDLTSAINADIVINGAEGSRNNWVSARINNDDVSINPTVGFSKGVVSVFEENSGIKKVELAVELSSISNSPVTVYYTTDAVTYGSATRYEDYIPVNGQITFAPGEKIKFIAIDVIGDLKYESDESFYVHLTSAIGADIVIVGAEGNRDSNVLVSIKNDDAKTSIQTGTAGSDLLVGDKNNNYFDGGLGIDTLVFTGNRIDHKIVKLPAGWAVSSPADGADILVNIERFKFSDTTIAVDIDGVAGQAYRIYQAAFNRTPDSEGLGYWINAMDQGKNLDSVAQGFVYSEEFKKLYGDNPTNAQIVTKLYDNVLHRAPDQGGYDYWLGVLDRQDATVAQVLARFSESPENVAALVGVMDNGVAFTPYPG